MVWYADGSIQVAANGQVATGTGTAFLKNVRIGDGLTIAGSASMHEVTNIASDTQLTFSPPFDGAAGAGKQYRIVPIQGYVKEAADRLREVLREAGPLIVSEALQALADATTDQERRAVVALGKVDNTADIDKPLSQAMLDALGSSSQKNPDLVTQAEAEEGTGTALRSWPVVRVWQAIAAWVSANLGTASTRDAVGAGDVYARGGVIGTVSQLNGVPTGAIIERGSNANGKYVKYADGRLICSQAFSDVAVNETYPGGSGQFSFRNTPIIWTYPHAFSAVPKVGGSERSAELPCVCGNRGVTTSAEVVIYFRSTVTGRFITVSAEGYWI